MANRLDRAAELFRAMSHPRGETLVRLAQNNPDLARQLDAAVAAFEATGSQRPLLALLSETTGLTDLPRARMAAISDAPPASRDPMSFEERVARDPNINNAVSELGMQGMPAPQKLDAYRQIAEAGSGDNFIDRLASYTVRPEYSLDLLPNNRPLFSADTGFGGGGSSMDVMPGAGIPSSPGTGLIPSGPRGLSAGGGGGLIVPPGRGLTTTGGDLSVQGMESPAPRGLPAPNQPRIEGPGQRRIEGPTASRPESFDVDDGAREAYQRMADGRSVTRRGEVSEDEYADLVTRDLQRQPFIESPRPTEAPRDPQLDAIADDYASRPRSGGGSPPGRRPPGRNAQPPGPSGPRKRNLLGAAAAAAGGAAAWKLGMDLMFPPGDRRETLGDAEMSTADLAAETSPPPSVMTDDPAPLSPRDQAQELIRKLNLMRREARGEVPEAPAMQREIDRLMAMSNQTMAAASRGEVATGGNDYHMQAARLMAQLNDMRSRAGGEVPQARQMMAEITRLQRIGDEQRNARQAPRRAG